MPEYANPSKIRVLHVIGNMNCGGAETLIMNLYRKLDRSVYQFDFVVHSEDAGYYDNEIISLGGKIYRTRKFNGINLSSYIRFWKEFFKKHPEYMIIHGHIHSSAFIYLWEAKKANRITIAHSHSTKYYKFTIKSFLHRIICYPLRYFVEYFFACSVQAGRDRFGEKSIHSDHFWVVRNGIDSDKYEFSHQIRQSIRKQSELADNNFVIGHVGRFTQQKNHKFIVKIFEILLKKDDSAILWLFGEGECEGEIRELIHEKNMDQKVKFWGVKSDIWNYMQAMDAFVFPSLNEGFGNVLMEAQASGLHCVVSDCLPPEADLGIQLINRLSLKSNPEQWADVILSLKGEKRPLCSTYIKENGYDSMTIVKKLQDFYAHAYKKRVK